MTVEVAHEDVPVNRTEHLAPTVGPIENITPIKSSRKIYQATVTLKEVGVTMAPTR